jgi:hypothetical protein
MKTCNEDCTYIVGECEDDAYCELHPRYGWLTDFGHPFSPTFLPDVTHDGTVNQCDSQ